MVELLVNTAVLALLVTLLGGVFSQVSRAWITGEAGIERRRSERAVTDFIASELRGAAVPVNRVATAGKSNLQFLINPASGEVPDDCRNADCIFWQAPIATETTFGDLAEVGYFLRWNPEVAEWRRPILCRFFVNPSVTSVDSARIPVPNPLYLIYRDSRWLSPALVGEVAPARPPAYRGFFAENVVGFWIEAFRPDGTELLTSGEKSYDSRIGYRFAVSNGTMQERFLPSRVQVSIAQLSAASATQIDIIGGRLQALVKRDDVRNAGDFLTKLQDEAKGDGAMARVLPGLRIHTTDVRLENSR